MSTVCEARGLRISSPYPVLAILTLVVVVNYFDRYILSILVEPIRHELGLSDTQIGLLTGAGFALLYSTMAIPIARVAERRNRIMIVALAVAIWSAATCLCGLASSFILLFMARVMVGCGRHCSVAIHGLGPLPGQPPRRCHVLSGDGYGSRRRARAGTGWDPAECARLADDFHGGGPGGTAPGATAHDGGARAASWNE